MKFIWIFYIFLINQVLLQSDYDLRKDQKLTTDSAVIFFDATNFKVNDNIYLIITGNFSVEYIEYAFEDDLPAYADELDIEGFILKREYLNKMIGRPDIGEDYEERYFTIEKTQDKIKSGQEGKYLIILPNMDGSYDIENTNTNKGNSKVISEKYKTVETENPIIFFDTSDFKVGDEIYLIISGEFMYDEIYYAFIDDISTTEYFNFEEEKPNKNETIKDRGDDYESKYYTIKKTKEAIKEGEGKYLLLLIYMYGKYKIENTEENKGNTNLIIIVVVVVVVVIAVILFIICYCRRKKQAAINQENYQYNNNVKVYNNGYNTNDQVYKDGNQGFNNNPNYDNNNDPNFGPQNSNYPQF